MSYTTWQTVAIGIQYYIHIIEQLTNYTISVFVCLTNNTNSVI